MRKCGNISQYMGRPLVINDFATAPFWISLYVRKIWFSFLSVWASILCCPKGCLCRWKIIGLKLAQQACGWHNFASIFEQVFGLLRTMQRKYTNRANQAYMSPGHPLFLSPETTEEPKGSYFIFWQKDSILWSLQIILNFSLLKVFNFIFLLLKKLPTFLVD